MREGREGGREGGREEAESRDRRRRRLHSPITVRQATGFGKKYAFVNGTVSSPLDRSKRFTVHPWQTCSFRLLREAFSHAAFGCAEITNSHCHRCS